MMKKALSVLAMALVLLGVTGCGGGDKKAADGAGKPVKLQIGFTTAEDPNDPYYSVSKQMAELVSKKSGGKMEIQLFANGQLGQEREMFEGMQMGSVDMAVMTNSYVSNFVPACSALDLPFIFKDADQAMKVLNGPYGQSLFKAFDKAKVVPLAWGLGGFRNLITTEKAVKTPDDLKGLKIRCLENKVYMNTYKTLGANPTPMAWSETIPGLQQKTVEGLDASITVLYTGGFADICKNLSVTNQFFAATLVCISKNKWDKLTPDQQKWLREAAQQACNDQAKAQVKRDNDNLKKMQDKGMNIVRDVDYAAFKAKLGDFYNEQKKTIGAKYVDNLMAAIK